MNILLSDIRLGVRLMLRSRGFALVAVLALALGIGANTAIFSAIDAVLIRPLPFPDPERLAFIWEESVQYPRNTPSPANFSDWQHQNQVFSAMSASRGAVASLTGDGEPESIYGRNVMPGYFDVLGVRPLLGRTLTAADEAPGEKVAVLSYGLWRRRYGGDPNIVNRAVLMDGEKVTVVGVMPAVGTLPAKRCDFWIPSRLPATVAARRGSHFLTVIGRLKPGVSLERAQSDMSTIASRLARDYPNTNTNVGVSVVSFKDEMVQDSRIGLLVLFGGSICVLLIACANVANLLLARAAVRQREMAVRTAIGAPRARIIRQMITESVLLSLIGGACGMVLARAGLQVLDSLLPSRMGLTLSINGRVLAFSACIALLTGVVFGLAPAIHASRLDLNEVLKQGMRAGSNRKAVRLRDALVVAEFAVALVLLVGAGLLIQTLSRLRAVDLGFQPDNVLTMRTPLPRLKYDTGAKRVQFYEGVLARVRALPGVDSAGYTNDLPFTTRGDSNSFLIEGRPDPAPGNEQDALLRECTSDYLRTMRVHLLEGRLLGRDDRAGSMPVVVINQTLAKAYFANESPLGKRIKMSMKEEGWRTIVGVVADIREVGIENKQRSGVYIPVAQCPECWGIPLDLAVRTQGNPTALAGAVRQAIWEQDRDQPIRDLQTLASMVDAELANHKQQMILLGTFAALALVLAALGIYGVLSYSVAQRTREIGVRMALGAQAIDVLRIVTLAGLRLAGVGLALGAAVALLLTQAMTRVLFEVSPLDPLTYAVVTATLVSVALLACAIPAIRASRLDPLAALRDE